MRDSVEEAIKEAFIAHKQEVDGNFDPLQKIDNIVAIMEERVMNYNNALMEFFAISDPKKTPLEIINDWIGKYTKAQQIAKTPIYENLTRYVVYFLEMLRQNQFIE